MRLFRFDADTAQRTVTAFGSRNVVISGILRNPEIAHIGCLHLGPDGLVGEHPTTTTQLLLIVQGSGEVRGGALDFVPITAGQAAFWEAGEAHETRSEEGMMALVIEGLSLDPTAIMVPLSLRETYGK